jgi:hypothetical protein
MIKMKMFLLMKVSFVYGENGYENRVEIREKMSRALCGHSVVLFMFTLKELYTFLYTYIIHIPKKIIINFALVVNKNNNNNNKNKI